MFGSYFVYSGVNDDDYSTTGNHRVVAKFVDRVLAEEFVKFKTFEFRQHTHVVSALDRPRSRSVGVF